MWSWGDKMSQFLLFKLHHTIRIEVVSRVIYLYNFKGQKLKIMIVNNYLQCDEFIKRKINDFFSLEKQFRKTEDQGCAEVCGFEFSVHFIHTVGNYIVTARERRNVKIVECDILNWTS